MAESDIEQLRQLITEQSRRLEALEARVREMEARESAVENQDLTHAPEYETPAASVAASLETPAAEPAPSEPIEIPKPVSIPEETEEPVALPVAAQETHPPVEIAPPAPPAFDHLAETPTPPPATPVEHTPPQVSPPIPVTPAVQQPPYSAPSPAPAQFMSEEEFHGKIAKATPPAPSPAKRDEGWEVRLMTTWLPRIGGVFALIGAAIIAALFDSPWLKVGIGYGVAGMLGLAGFWAKRRSETAGHVTIAISLALAYFVSFGGGFIDAMAIFPRMFALLLMVGFAGGIVGLAERWRSEGVAGMGFGLGVLAALISANTSAGFALINLSVLALAAGVLLVRHEWKRLTSLALVGTYLATLGLWIISPIDHSPLPVMTHLGALLFYHLVFSAAFLKWGRIWLARERAAEEAVRHDAAPEIVLESSPFSTGGALLNSLLFSALSVYLVWSTSVFWDRVHVLLFALAGLEAARLFVPMLRRGTLLGFHALMVFVLAASGIVAAFSGMAESAVMAAMALVVAIAATRSRGMRWLRPLTAVCAFLTVLPYFKSVALTTPFDFVAAMLPGIFLLASALPWERIWVRKVESFTHGPLMWIELGAGQFRSLVAVVSIIWAMGEYFNNNDLGIILSVGIASSLLVLGMAVLRARAWFLGTVIFCLGAFFFMMDNAGSTARYVPLQFVWWGAMLYLWGDCARKTLHLPARILNILVQLCIALCLILYAGVRLEHHDPFSGILAALMAGAAAFIALLGNRLPELPVLVRQPDVDPYEKFRHNSFDTTWEIFRPGYFGGLALAGLALLLAVMVDAKTNLVSAGVLSIAGIGAWFMTARRMKSNFVAQTLILLAVTVVWNGALFVFGDGEIPFIFGAMISVGIFYVLGIARRRFALLAVSVPWLMLIPSFCIAAFVTLNSVPRFDALCGLGVALLALVAHRLLLIAKQRFDVEQLSKFWQAFFSPAMNYWLVFAGTLTGLVFLASGALVTDVLITASWGVVFIALIVSGLLMADRAFRYAGISTLIFTIARIFAHDLVSSPLRTKGVAFFAVGLFTIFGGLAYVFLQRRLLPQEKPDSEPSVPPSPNDEGSSTP